MEWEERREDRKWGRKIREEKHFFMFGLRREKWEGMKISYIFLSKFSLQIVEKMREKESKSILYISFDHFTLILQFISSHIWV